MKRHIKPSFGEIRKVSRQPLKIQSGRCDGRDQRPLKPINPGGFCLNVNIRVTLGVDAPTGNLGK